VAAIERNTELGEQIKADAKRYVLHSWSVQDALDPIPVAGAEGRYFWDYDGNRYLDFASQLVNVSIGTSTRSSSRLSRSRRNSSAPSGRQWQASPAPPWRASLRS
jgi:acetylornithine/succinyldiaminopimelate/putrescine aminotransferase